MNQPASLSSELLTFLEAVPDLYLILSPDLIIQTATGPYLQATGKTLADIQGRHVFDVFPDNPVLPESDATANLRSSLEWALQHKKPHRMALQRYDVPHPDIPGVFREKYWLPVNTPVLDKEGQVLYLIHKVEDVTLQQTTQKQLHGLEQLAAQQSVFPVPFDVFSKAGVHYGNLYDIFMQTPALMCILEGPQFVFRLFNPPYQRAVGNRPLLGKPLAEAIPEFSGQDVLELLHQVYQTGESLYMHEMKVQLDHQNNGELGNNYYNFTYQAIRDLQGEVCGVLMFAYEVTAHVQARQEVEEREKALQLLNRQLEEANQLVQAANAELHRAQHELQVLNGELEERIAERTRELERSRATTEEQRKLLHTIFLNAPSPFVILDGPDMVFQLVNPSFQQIFPGRDMLGKPLLEALPEIAASPLPDILKQVYQTGETYQGVEFPLLLARHQDAEPEEIIFTFTYQPRRNEQEAIDGILVFAHEVTEQVRARQVVERSAKQLKLITDALPVLIGYLDKEEKYRFTNKAYEEWFPLKANELIGRPIKEIIGETAYRGVKQYIDRALAGERLDFESRMPYREDFVKYIRTSYIPDIREGEVAGFYTLVNDITQQVENLQKIEEREREALALTRKLAAANQDLQAVNKQLRHTNIDLDNFIYTASHDLKSPIANIEGLMQLLFDALPKQVLVDLELEGIADMIGKSIARFNRTISHLTEVVKLQKENNQEPVVVDLAAVIRDVQLDLAPELKETGMHLEVDVAGCPYVSFSEKNMRSIVYNLLSNAIKYRSPDRIPVVRISCRHEEEFVALSVKDNGLGVELSGNKKLFKMFSRLHDHVEGSGIGLYMVKRMVENAGGHIEVESQVGEGSTFTVYLKGCRTTPVL